MTERLFEFSVIFFILKEKGSEDLAFPDETQFAAAGTAAGILSGVFRKKR